MSLEKHVNNSGFPLQLGLAHKIKSTASEHGWKVLYQEHSWKNVSEGGFIDLVLEDRYRTWLMNIECKRVLDTSWIFIVPPGKYSKHRHCKLWISCLSDKNLKCFNWVDIPVDPETYQAQFCVIPGQDKKARPMLERTAAAVVSSTEALAVEEASVLSEKYSNLRIYTNVIVTTANLKVCRVDPNKVDLVDGTLKEFLFEDVPFLRFRKQLSYNAVVNKEDSKEDSIRSLISQKENTVFIVQASEFIKFLKDIELPDNVRPYIENR